MNEGHTPREVILSERRNTPPHHETPHPKRKFHNRVLSWIATRFGKHTRTEEPHQEGFNLDNRLGGDRNEHPVIDTEAARRLIDETYIGLQFSDGSRMVKPTPPSDEPPVTDIPSFLSGLFPPEQPSTEGLGDGEQLVTKETFNRDQAADLLGDWAKRLLEDANDQVRLQQERTRSRGE